VDAARAASTTPSALTAMEPALASLETALARLCAGLDAVLPAEDPAAAGPVRPRGDWLADLRRLDQLMRDGDSAALAMFAACAPEFKADFGVWDGEAIERGLHGLDFEGAHAALQWVIYKHELVL
jgi:hypothetical protein